MKNGCIILGSNSQLTSYLWYLVLAAASTESKQPSNQPSNQEKKRMLNELIHYYFCSFLPIPISQSGYLSTKSNTHPNLKNLGIQTPTNTRECLPATNPTPMASPPSHPPPSLMDGREAGATAGVFLLVGMMGYDGRLY